MRGNMKEKKSSFLGARGRPPVWSIVYGIRFLAPTVPYPRGYFGSFPGGEIYDALTPSLTNPGTLAKLPYQPES